MSNVQRIFSTRFNDGRAEFINTPRGSNLRYSQIPWMEADLLGSWWSPHNLTEMFLWHNHVFCTSYVLEIIEDKSSRVIAFNSVTTRRLQYSFKRQDVHVMLNATSRTRHGSWLIFQFMDTYGIIKYRASNALSLYSDCRKGYVYMMTETMMDMLRTLATVTRKSNRRILR